MRWVFLLILISCASEKTEKIFRSELVITEHYPDKKTSLVKQNLIHLTQVYDLEPYMYSRRVDVDPKSKDHPYPTLTLSTKFSDQPELILSRFLHEQFLWWIGSQLAASKKASADLKKAFPEIKVKDAPELISSFLEHEALKKLVGKASARRIIHALAIKWKITPKTYQLVLRNQQKIQSILKAQKLIPQTLDT